MLPNLHIVLDADGAFPEVLDQEVLFEVSAIGRLPKGMSSGKASVIIEFVTPTGLHLYGQTTLALLNATVRAMLVAEAKDGVVGY